MRICTHAFLWILNNIERYKMKYLKCLLLLLPLLVASCGDNDEPYTDLFSIAVKLEDGYDGEVKIIKHECEATISGEQQYVKVTLSGDFDNLQFLKLTSNAWTMVTSSSKSFSVLVLTNGTGAVRSDNIDFVVSKGSVKNVGTVSIVQLPNQ